MAAWCDLIFNQWWTNETGKTGDTGKFTTRGFLGDYRITVTHAGKTLVRETSRAKSGAVVIVKAD